MQAQNTKTVLDIPKPLAYRFGMSDLKRIRETKGLTQQQLAEAVGTSQPQIKRLESGERKLTKEWAERLAPHLGVRARDLLFSDPDLQIVPIHELGGGTEPEETASFGSETGVRGGPKGGIAEIDVTAGLGAGGLTTVTEATALNGMRFTAEVVRDFWVLPNWMLSRLNVQPHHVAAFLAQGDSMEPSINNNDVVFIDTRHRVPSPGGVYAMSDEFGGVILKRLEVASSPRDEEISVRIISDNPRHEAKVLRLDDIQIIGRFIGKFTTDLGH